MKRIVASKSALKDDPAQSLFKFRLFFHENTTEYRSKNGKPWVWYSFDMPEEREMFPPGLEHNLRALHTSLLEQAYKWPDLFNFLKECYPVYQPRANAEPILNYYMPKSCLPMMNDISARYSETLNFLMKGLGVTDWRVNHAATSRTVPGFSPAKLPSQDFYGTGYFERNPTVSFWFATKKLKIVKIYDNRCYSRDNEIAYLDQSQYPEPTGVLSAPPRIIRTGHTDNGRLNRDVSVGSILANLPNPTH